MTITAPLSEVEGIKTKSNFLRGTIAEGLKNRTTGSFVVDDTQLTKFHGFYQQDDRDLRAERKAQKLEPLFSFMLRARVPGGVATPEQWLAIDKIAGDLTEAGSLRLTTRQTFQYHGVYKSNLKSVIQEMDKVMIDSIAACGDVNRNIMCNPNPVESQVHTEVYGWAKAISEHLLPNTKAYYELWFDDKRVADNHVDVEPIYGETYLPRKFKAAVAIPPHNDVDVYANDMGFIAIIEDGKLSGFNVAVGGGMGTTHGDVKTYPRAATDFGFILPEDTLKVAEAILTTQRDFGNRSDRKQSRLKYTIDRIGVAKYIEEVETRSGVKFAPLKPVTFTQQGDRIGWVKGVDGNWHLTLFIESGRIKDYPGRQLRTGLTEIAKIHKGDFRMTSNQNLIIASVGEAQKSTIEGLARQYGLMGETISLLKENAMACVSLPTCSLAMAEAERYLPAFVSKVELLTEKHQLTKQPIVMRMTGCPNGCARPFMAEIGFVGKAAGRYNMYLGSDGIGSRVNKLYKENIDEATILSELDQLFGQYAEGRQPDETFGNYVVRAGVVKAVNEGRLFHE
jgi:sulfite reductase (NADPH) hemoprotein beta-component